jgi:hypothetical protein
MYEMDLSDCGLKPATGSCEYCDEPSGSYKTKSVSWLADQLLACYKGKSPVLLAGVIKPDSNKKIKSKAVTVVYL